jgi:hypothetical protein
MGESVVYDRRLPGRPNAEKLAPCPVPTVK